jgi:hypothetical protein
LVPTFCPSQLSVTITRYLRYSAYEKKKVGSLCQRFWSMLNQPTCLHHRKQHHSPHSQEVNREKESGVPLSLRSFHCACLLKAPQPPRSTTLGEQAFTTWTLGSLGKDPSYTHLTGVMSSSLPTQCGWSAENLSLDFSLS